MSNERSRRIRRFAIAIPLTVGALIGLKFVLFENTGTINLNFGGSGRASSAASQNPPELATATAPSDFSGALPGRQQEITMQMTFFSPDEYTVNGQTMKGGHGIGNDLTWTLVSDRRLEGHFKSIHMTGQLILRANGPDVWEGEWKNDRAINEPNKPPAWGRILLFGNMASGFSMTALFWLKILEGSSRWVSW